MKTHQFGDIQVICVGDLANSIYSEKLDYILVHTKMSRSSFVPIAIKTLSRSSFTTYCVKNTSSQNSKYFYSKR